MVLMEAKLDFPPSFSRENAHDLGNRVFLAADEGEKLLWK